MPPINFNKLASRAFDNIKRSLSIDALYLPKSGGQFEIRGPFDNRVQQVDPDIETVVSSNLFSFGLKLEDIPQKPKKGDKLIVNNITYQVIDSQEDGIEGVSTFLLLHKVKV